MQLDMFPENKGKSLSNGNGMDFDEQLAKEVEFAGGEYRPKPEFNSSVGVTMFDVPSSKDNLLTVLVSKENLSSLPSQSLVSIGHQNLGDGRVYQGIVVEGPFYEPDGIKADASIIVTTAVNGVMFMPKYHGRVMIEVMGEIVNNRVIPPRYRPLPNSPVFSLGIEETKKALKVDGDITIGQVIGQEEIEVKIPSNNKAVLPRHLGIIGTTGGGKSTTVSGQVDKFQQANIATILVDTEGEYTNIYEPTDKDAMIEALKRRGQEPKGIKNVTVLKLHGRESTCEDESKIKEFSLTFENISPYAMTEILELNEAQEERYMKAYDLARELLRRLKIFPTNDKDETQRMKLIELDEMEKSYPKLQLSMMYDIVQAVAKLVDKDEDGLENINLFTHEFKNEKTTFINFIKEKVKGSGKASGNKGFSSARSWFKVQGSLGKLLRLKIFDIKDKVINYDLLTKSGSVSVLDLSDTDSPQINNLVIAELMRGTLEKQNDHYQNMQKAGSKDPNKVMIIIEEAHEFLSRERIKQMPTLKQQVARIARRGRKRWLGLVFVTQLPQHLPDEMLALINSFILHKISDDNVISRLKRSIGGVDDSMWRKLPGLASGQAIVSTPSLSRALLVAIDPTPCKLLMVD